MTTYQILSSKIQRTRNGGALYRIKAQVRQLKHRDLITQLEFERLNFRLMLREDNVKFKGGNQ